VTRVLGPPGDFPVLLLPVRSGGDAVACIIATGGVSGVETYAEEYLLVAKKLDWALQMLRLRKKLLEA
jgi:hypothetical protein